MQELVERGAEADRLEAEITEVCGILSAATGRLAGPIGDVVETETWQGFGIRSPEHWVSWKCGVSARRAGALVAMARRLGELPETRAALDAGELSEDQVAVVCRLAPAGIDAEVAELARHATVTQLRRVLGLANLICLCQHHHRLAPPRRPGHRGGCRRSAGRGLHRRPGQAHGELRPAHAPGRPPPPARQLGPPSGERLDPWPSYFNEPAA